MNVKGGKVIATFVDFQEVFDVIDRDLLFYHLIKYGITGKVLQLLKQMYSDSSNVIKINGLLSNGFVRKKGVKQGDNISPTCFNLFINELIKELRGCNVGVNVNGTLVNVLVYADDIVLLANNEVEMQTLLNTLHRWCTNWHVKINPGKTKAVHFGKKNTKESSVKLKLGHSVIEFVQKYKYLGITISSNLDLDCITECLARAGSRALSKLICKTHSNYDLGYASFTTLFNSCVAPILDYASGA